MFINKFKKIGLLPIFIFIFISSATLFFIQTQSFANKVFVNTDEKIIHEMDIIKMSTEIIFGKYEGYLDILGHQILQNISAGIENNQELIDNLLDVDPTALGYGLISLDGNLIYSTSNINVNNIPNFLENEQTRYNFKKVLNSNGKNIVIGRTYKLGGLNKLIIPLRKKLLNSDGKAVAIMTVGIGVENTFKDTFNTNNDLLVSLYKNGVYRVQLSNSKLKYPVDTVVPLPVVKNFFSRAKKDMKTLSDGSIHIFTTTSRIETIRVGVVFLKNYDVWLIIGIPYDTINTEINMNLMSVGIVFLLFNIIFGLLLFIVSKTISNKTKELEYLSIHDNLTGIGNRYFLSKHISDYKSYTLFFIDLDNFKFINDTFGHNYGDQFLIKVADELKKLVMDDELLIRYSGDEFIIITHELNTFNLEKRAQEFLDIIKNSVNKYQHQTTFSIGIAQALDGEKLHITKQRADLALYKAKEKLNTYVFFNNKIENEYQQKHLIEGEILQAMLLKEIYMVYQPQVDKDGKVIGIEALVRWNSPKLGFINPEVFIDVAEKSGTMILLGDYIIDNILLDLKYIDIENVSINISVKQFMEHGFLEKLVGKLELHNIDTNRITLEVTENIFIIDIEYMKNLTEKLHGLGLRISIDDFGTGYSSLSSIKYLTIDELKIDKSFVDDITNDELSKSMAETIIKMGKIFNMQILAEGIEQPEQKEILSNLGCDLYQGYLYAKPLSLEDLQKFIKHNKGL